MFCGFVALRDELSREAQPDHWSECGRAVSVGDSDAVGRPHRSVLSLAVITRMNKRFIISVTLGLALLDWILFFVLLFCFDDHFPGDPPPGIVELAIAHTIQVLAFPLMLVVTWLGKDPPYFFLSSTVLLLVGGFVWAILFEGARHIYRRFSFRRASP